MNHYPNGMFASWLSKNQPCQVLCAGDNDQKTRHGKLTNAVDLVEPVVPFIDVVREKPIRVLSMNGDSLVECPIKNHTLMK